MQTLQSSNNLLYCSQNVHVEGGKKCIIIAAFSLVDVIATCKYHLHIVVRNDVHSDKLLITAAAWYEYAVCQSVTHDPTPSEQTVTHLDLQLYYPRESYFS